MSARQARKMVEMDRVCERRRKKSERSMRRKGITVAEMAGMMH